MLIYKATNKYNGKIYIGLTTKTLQDRIKSHKSDSRNGTTYFNRAVRKYGVEGFDWEVVDTAESIEELQQKEIYYIDLYNTFDNPDEGYNTASGGQFFEVTEEEKKRRSERVRGEKNPMYGVPSPMRGRTFSKEHRKKMSESGKKVDRHWLRGGTNPSAVPVIELTSLKVYPTITEAVKDTKVSETGVYNSINGDKYIKGLKFKRYEEGVVYEKVPKGPTRKVPVRNIDTGEVFKSITEASEKYGCARKGIRDCCNGIRETYKDFRWEYY